jgi:hypothetical protein
LSDGDIEQTFGKVVGTLNNPTCSKICVQRLKNKATSVRVKIEGKKNSTFLILSDETDREQLKKMMSRNLSRKQNFECTLYRSEQSTVRSATITNSKQGAFAEGFNLPSDEEEKAGSKKKGSKSKKAGSCKPSPKKCNKNNHPDDDENGENGDDDESENSSGENDNAGSSKTKSNQKRSSAKQGADANDKGSKKKGKGGKSTKKKTMKNKDDDDSGKGGSDSNDDDDDDDVDDCFGDNLKACLDKQVQDKSQRRVSVFVSNMFYNTAKDDVVKSVTCDRPGKTFYAKAEHIKMLMRARHEKMMIGNVNKPVEWIDSIKDIKIRKEEHGRESKWRRTGGKGNTTEVVTFVVSVPADEEEQLRIVIENIFNEYFLKIFKKRTHNSAGELALAYAQSLPTDGPSGGLYNWLVNAKGGGDEEKTMQVMTEELHNHWKDGVAYHYDVPLDKFMVDYDIKEFIVNYVGCDSWNELTDEMKKACYRDYPRRALPDWNSIVEESY